MGHLVLLPYECASCCHAICHSDSAPTRNACRLLRDTFCYRFSDKAFYRCHVYPRTPWGTFLDKFAWNGLCTQFDSTLRTASSLVVILDAMLEPQTLYNRTVGLQQVSQKETKMSNA